MTKKTEEKKKKKYEITKRAKFNDSLLPVIQNLSAEGRSESDIGAMIGYSGKNPETWLKFLKNKYPEIEDAIEIGKKMADIKLVVSAFEAAVGYDYEEEEIEYINRPKMDGIGEFSPILRSRYIERGRKVRRKHAKHDTAMLKFLLCNRLPEFFQDIKKFEVDKRSMEFKGDISKEIKKFAGSLGKIIDSEFVETEKNDG